MLRDKGEAACASPEKGSDAEVRRERAARQRADTALIVATAEHRRERLSLLGELHTLKAETAKAKKLSADEATQHSEWLGVRNALEDARDAAERDADEVGEEFGPLTPLIMFTNLGDDSECTLFHWRKQRRGCSCHLYR